MRVEFKKLLDNAIIPTRGTKYSAGHDLYSAENTIIPARGWKLIKTGIALAWDDTSYYAQVCSRSGLNLKLGIYATAGVIDFDYRNSIGVILMNGSSEDVEIVEGSRIAQLIFLKFQDQIEFEEVSEFEEIDSTRRGEGFGSTGK